MKFDENRIVEGGNMFLTRSSSFLEFLPTNFAGDIPEPSDNSFFYRVFNLNIETANQVVNTPYLQAMKRGELDPQYYGCLTVLDSYYCYNAVDTLNSLLCKVDQSKYPGLYALIKANLDSYKRYNATFLQDWHIRQSDNVTPTDTMRNYAKHEQNVMCYSDPIYTLVAYIPCYFLWPWFSQKIIESSGYHPGVYDNWFRGNYYGEDSYKSAWKLGNFIEEWEQQGNSFNETKASEIYRTSMQYELAVFTEAFNPSSMAGIVKK